MCANVCLYEFDPRITMVSPPPHEFIAIGGLKEAKFDWVPDGYVSLSLQLLAMEGLEQLGKRIRKDKDVCVKVRVHNKYFWRQATVEDLYAMVDLGRIEFPYYGWLKERERELQEQKEGRKKIQTLYKFVSEEVYMPPYDFVALGYAPGDALLDRQPCDSEPLSLWTLANEGLERLRERIKYNGGIVTKVKLGEAYYWRAATVEDLSAMIKLMIPPI